MAEQERPFYTLKQALGVLGYRAESTIYRMIEKGLLNPTQPGGRRGELRFDVAEVLAVRDRRRERAA